MKLSLLLKDIDYLSTGFDDIEITDVACNSNAVCEGNIFVAIRGARFDGHSFIDDAIRRGASAVVIQEDKRDIITPYPLSLTPVFIYVPDTTIALAQICNNFYDHPSKKLRVIGITGTNGKTTTSYLLDSILRAAGHKTGLIGTIHYRLGDRVIPAINTTPGILDIQSYLSQMVRGGLNYCVMEVSSHSLAQRRVDGVRFDMAVFTNLGSDHLDYHIFREDYFFTKLKLFEGLTQNEYAVVNMDDPYGKRIATLLRKDNRAHLIGYGYVEQYDIFVRESNFSPQGIRFIVCTPKGELKIHSKLLGCHNLYNILASIGAAISLGIDLDTIKYGVESLQEVRGRLESIDNPPFNFKIFIDYAHTDEALSSVLSAIKGLGMDIVLVFGCGGDRDRTKRAKMGKAASEYADFVYVTSDNPRSEDPQQIASQIEEGLKESNFKDYEIILDRLDAIRIALNRVASFNDEKLCLLIAGKGHETYQVLKDCVTPFDDRDVVRKLCLKMAQGQMKAQLTER